MSAIMRRSFEEPESTVPFTHGEARLVSLGGEQVWRSELDPGWSWDTDIKPLVGGRESCPMTHREFVASGQVRYLMDDGSEIEASAGDVLFIPPGHRAWVVGEERCVLIDW